MISDDKKVYDIAYCVHKKYWCQGYATEIAQGMIDYARGQGAEKVTIFVGQENTASNRVAQKCGGKIVSESTYKKKRNWHYHERLQIWSNIVIIFC